jgi:hypothetical protein
MDGLLELRRPAADWKAADSSPVLVSFKHGWDDTASAPAITVVSPPSVSRIELEATIWPEVQHQGAASGSIRGLIETIVPEPEGEVLKVNLAVCCRRPETTRGRRKPATSWSKYRWLRGQDLNLRPLGYEPNELPDCSTPRHGNLMLPYPRSEPSHQSGSREP